MFNQSQNFSKNQLWAILLLVVGGVIVLFLVFWIFWGDLNILSSKTARLEIKTSEGERAFEGKVINDMTMLEAFQASALAGNISFKFLMDGDNNKTKVINLDGYSSDRENQKLIIYLNDLPISSEEIHSVVIKPGDIISVKTE